MMKIRPSSKSFKSKAPNRTVDSPSDNMLFSLSELKQMRSNGNRSRILKLAIACLIIAAIGTTAYALQGMIPHKSYAESQNQQVQHQAIDTGTKQAQKQAAAQAQQEQCQTLNQKLASDQTSLSSAQEQYSSNQQALTTAEQQLSTDGPLLIPSTQNLIQAIQKDMSAEQSLIASLQQLVSQDEDYISKSGCS